MIDGNSGSSGSRFLGLEFLRGAAALVVAFSHGVIAFRPELFGLFENFPQQQALTSSPLFVFIHGTGAVVLFFVLSGFVLSYPALARSSMQPLKINLIKRYPRLAGPILLSVMLSWLLFSSGAYYYEQAGKITGSPWLQQFALSPLKPDAVHFADALKQGLLGALLQFQFSYNSPLWTMSYEFYGSIIVLGLAAAMLAVPASWRQQSGMLLAGAAAIMSWLTDSWYLAFVVGLALAIALANRPLPGLLRAKHSGWVLALAGLYLLGFSAPSGAYGWLGWADAKLVNMLGSVLLIVVALAHPPQAAWLRRVCRFLGQLSFPLYLVHVLVICSFSSFLMVALQEHDGLALRNALAIASVLASVLAAFPFVYLNERWLSLVNGGANKIAGRGYRSFSA